MTRRDFLKALPPAVLAASACGRTPYRKEDFAILARSPVAILPAPSYDADLTDLIVRGLDLLGLPLDVRGKRVFLKPNMVEYEVDKAINTNPRVVGAAATAFLKKGAREVVIGEGPGHRRDIEYLLDGTGLSDVLDDLRLRFVDLNHDDVGQVTLRSHFTGLESLWLPAEVLQSDIIVSMPKLKSHHLAGMTASMKNLFGFVPGAVYGWPKNLLHFLGIENSIIDLVATVRPHLTIVDGVVGMEGDGPILGRPRAVGLIAMGTDLVAVDATLARIIGLNPTKVPYLSMAGKFMGNIAEERIEQRAEPIERYRTRFDIIEPLRGMLA
jgi:uncharacterized protein (DUF362 family)